MEEIPRIHARGSWTVFGKRFVYEIPGIHARESWKVLGGGFKSPARVGFCAGAGGSRLWLVDLLVGRAGIRSFLSVAEVLQIAMLVEQAGMFHCG